MPSSSHHPRPSLRRLLLSLSRIADLQYRILLLRAKLTLRRLAFFAVLLTIALLLGLLAIIFLYLAAFQLLASVLSPFWAFLILGALHLLLATILALLAVNILNASDEPKSPRPASPNPQQPPAKEEPPAKPQ